MTPFIARTLSPTPAEVVAELVVPNPFSLLHMKRPILRDVEERDSGRRCCARDQETAGLFGEEGETEAFSDLRRGRRLDWSFFVIVQKRVIKMNSVCQRAAVADEQ